MPWTRKQVKFLFSKESPLTGKQKDKMESELHANPSLGHKKKGHFHKKHHSANDGSFIDNRRCL